MCRDLQGRILISGAGLEKSTLGRANPEDAQIVDQRGDGCCGMCGRRLTKAPEFSRSSGPGAASTKVWYRVARRERGGIRRRNVDCKGEQDNGSQLTQRRQGPSQEVYVIGLADVEYELRMRTLW